MLANRFALSAIEIECPFANSALGCQSVSFSCIFFAYFAVFLRVLCGYKLLNAGCAKKSTQSARRKLRTTHSVRNARIGSRVASTSPGRQS